MCDKGVDRKRLAALSQGVANMASAELFIERFANRLQYRAAAAYVGCVRIAGSSEALAGYVIGWEAGIRTPITWSRATCPTVERPPNWQVETRIIPDRPR